jgi:hypothetical protein
MCGVFLNRIAENMSDRWPKAADWCSNKYNEYIVDRCVLHGLPVSLIVTVACAKYFQSTSILSAALFAVVNYTVVTSAVETMRRYRDISMHSRTAIIVVGGVLSAVAVQQCSMGTLSYKSSFILTLAAFSGQVFRAYMSADE